MGGELNLELPSTPSKEIDISKTQEDINAISDEFKAIVNRDKVGGSFLGMGGWRSIALKDAAKWLSGGTPPKDNADYWGGSIPWISAKSMKGNRFNDSELKLTEAGLKKGSRLAPKNAVLLLVRGSMLHQRIPIGIATKQVAFNQDVKAIIPKDDFLPLYFLYSLSGREQELLDKVENTGIGAGKLDTSVLYQMKIFCPPIEEQKAIAHILGSLDDKIELNRQTNQTLEAMAQALFKSWFVDFDPVIDNALAAGNEIPEVLKDRANARKALGDKRKALPEDVRGLFPSSFVHTEELGWIPEGWEVKKITDIVETVSETYQLKTVKKIIFLNTGDILDGRFLHRSYSDVSTLPGQAKKSIQKGDILFSEIRPKNKRFAYVNFNAENHVVSTKLMVLRTNKEFSSLFLYFILKQSNTIDILQKAAESRSGTFPQITFNELSAISLALPTEPDLINFYSKNFLANYFDQFFKLNDQSITLTSLRDTLLPKLISGELRIANVEKLVEELK